MDGERCTEYASTQTHTQKIARELVPQGMKEATKLTHIAGVRLISIQYNE